MMGEIVKAKDDIKSQVEEILVKVFSKLGPMPPSGRRT